MATSVDICNAALGMLGVGGTITTLNDNSLKGQVCKRYYDRTRKQLLRMHAWSFAIQSEALVNTPSTPTHPLWDNIYNRPADCIRVLNVHRATDNEPVEHVVEREDKSPTDLSIFANLPSLYIRYIKDVQTVDDFDDLFDQALTVLLAAKMAMALGKGGEMAEKLRVEFLNLMPVAAGTDSEEGHSEDRSMATWIEDRQ